MGLGGSLGALARFALTGFVRRLGVAWPLGTLLVNVLGCLLMGALLGLFWQRDVLSTNARLFLVVGFLGSLTTFSALGYETFELWRAGAPRLAAASVAANVAFGVGAVWLGCVLGGRLAVA